VIVAHPRLWSLEAPHLYRVAQTVERGGRAVDSTNTTFGIRTIRFDPATGFYLNGKPVKIQGTCNHQDFAGVGIAVPDSLEYWRVKKLKEMGSNAWRMSHNPPTPSLLDACDREGMLVMDENRHLGDTYSDHTPSRTSYSNLSDLASMIQRDRNHPSIIMWSMCNEEGLQGSPEGARIFAAMMKVVHQYDQTRPITCAMNGGWFNPGIRAAEDLVGVNYSPEVYEQLHQRFPQIPVYASETASTLTTRGVYADDRAHAWVSSYNMTDGSWQPVAVPFVAGSFPWTGFDYKGEPTPYGWPDINSNFGIMDMCGFPKDNYYYYQSWWGTKPILHLMPHWNWPGKEGQEIRVIAFSNCDRVELFLNGQSLGAKEMPRNGHLEWTVRYAPGRLTANGYDGSTVAATDTVETTGAPAALRLRTDRTTLAADGEDLTPVEVDLVDAHGRIVPTAGNRVTFSVTGAGHIAGVGNGNPSDHDPDKASERRAFNGKCMVIVGAGEQPGAIRLTATSPGLKPAVLSLRGAERAER
jgi:beta-galactosidase